MLAMKLLWTVHNRSSCFSFVKNCFNNETSRIAFLVLHVFHVENDHVLYRRIVGNKAFFSYLLEEDNKQLPHRVFHLSNIFSTI